MDDIKLVVAIISSVTVLALSYINYRLSRRGDKKSKKTEMRAQSYIDFVNCIAELARASKDSQARGADTLTRLADSKTRIAIYGDASVIRALAEFDRKYSRLDTDEACDSFMNIIVEMRLDAVGKRKDEKLDDLKQIILGSKP